MNLAQALAALAAHGTEPNRKVYRRHGARGELYGVGFQSLDMIAQEVGVDHGLARKLWSSARPEARLLATRIADARKVSVAELDRWAAELDWFVGADALAKLASASPHAKKLALSWIDQKGEWVSRAGWHTLALLTRDKSIDAAFFAPLVDRIERTIHRSKNRTRDAMNAALIAIGVRSDDFAKTCIAAAKRIGEVKVDHGAPGLETPDAATYIRRARAWFERARAAKKRPAEKKVVAKATKSIAKKSPKKAARRGKPGASRVAKKTTKAARKPAPKRR